MVKAFLSSFVLRALAVLPVSGFAVSASCTSSMPPDETVALHASGMHWGNNSEEIHYTSYSPTHSPEDLTVSNSETDGRIGGDKNDTHTPEATIPSATPVPSDEPTVVSPASGMYRVSKSGKIHNSSCRWYHSAKGNLTDSPQGTDCKICGGRQGKQGKLGKHPSAPSAPSTPSVPSAPSARATVSPASGMYRVSKSGKIHNSSCRYYHSANGNLTNSPQGTDCKICGGRQGK